MPRIKLTKSAIDALPLPSRDQVYWDTGCPGFGVKVTPKGRKVFIVLYRTGGAGSKLRKYTIGPYGRITLHQARIAAQRVFAARLEGRDPAAEKRETRRRVESDQVKDLVETYIAQHVSKNRSAYEISRILRREVVPPWTAKSIYEITKRDVVELIWAIAERGTPSTANKTLKVIKAFLGWCVGRAILDRSPAEGIPSPAKMVARDRVLTDRELGQIILAARKLGGPYGGIVELLALTGQRRQEVAGMEWSELDLAEKIWTLPKSRTKNAKGHIVHLSDQSISVLKRAMSQPTAETLPELGTFVFSPLGTAPFQRFSQGKLQLDELSGVIGWRLHDLRRTCVSGMAALGIAPHVADKILNHQSGTISGVAAVYQRHEFPAERREALERWGNHVAGIVAKTSSAVSEKMSKAA
jgi:integrase